MSSVILCKGEDGVGSEDFSVLCIDKAILSHVKFCNQPHNIVYLDFFLFYFVFSV